MPDISELQQRIRKAKQDVLNALPELAALNTIAAKGLAERKIQEIGFGAKYSNNRVPAWYFEGQQLNKAGENYLIKKSKYDEKNAKVVDGQKVYAEDAGVTWSEFRQAQGLPVDHVNLSYTNKMWAGMGPQQPYYEGQKIVCPLGGNNVEVINKLTWNFQHYGDFIGKVISDREIELLTAALVERVQIILSNNGFKK